jgi:ABC-type transport system substrate-binding protein
MGRWGRYILWGTIIVVVLFAATGFAALSIVRVPQSGGTATISFGDRSLFINPLLASTDTDTAVTFLLFRGLTQRSLSGQIVPGLAESWSVTKGGKAYTFRLRHGLHWQNGSGLTSADVGYTLRLLASSTFPTHDTVWSGVRVSTPDAHTVVIRLPNPDYTFLQQTTVGIVPNQYAHSSWPVGSGSFNLKTVAPTAIQLTTAKDETQAALHLSGVIIREGSSPGKPTVSCRRTVGPRLPAGAVPSTRMLGLEFNVHSLPDTVTRRALLAAIGHYSGLTFLSPTPGWPAPQVSSPFKSSNPATLLRAGGWRLQGGSWRRSHKTLRVVLAEPWSPSLSVFNRDIRSALSRIHVQVQIKKYSFAEFIRSALYRGAFDAALVDWNFGSPDYAPAVYWHSGGALNFARLKSPSIDGLTAQIPRSATMSRRDAIRSQIGDWLLRNAVAAGVGPDGYSCRVTSSLHDFHLPTLVSDAGELLLSAPQWYLHYTYKLRNPTWILHRLP